MSDAFVELTSKNLHPTRAHMVIFTNDALPEDKLPDKLQPIFGIQWLQEVFNAPSPSSPLKNHHPRRPSAHRVRNPTVRIVIMSDDPSSSDQQQQQRQYNLNNTENGSKSTSSSFCYQIPFHFKGFHHHHSKSKQPS
jgi:hypothetical protein